MALGEVLVAPFDLKRFVVQVLSRTGMAELDAAKVADVLVWANLRGQDGHGVARLPRYLEMIQSGDLDPKARPEIEIQTQAIFVLNAKRAAGAVAMTIAVEEACKRAKVAGACFGLVRETTHLGAIGRYVHQAVENECAILMAAAGPPFMAYHGAKIRSLSTSPIAIGVPGDTAGAVVLDMATSVTSMGQINQARARGKSIPEGWAIGELGKATTDPAEGVIPLPMGGPKGSGLSLMFELLTGVLGATPILAKALGPKKQTHHIQNAFLLALDIKAFRSPLDFRQDVDELVAIIKELPVREGFDEILLPGERGRKIELTRRKEGVPLPPATWQALSQIAMTQSVEMPATAASSAP